jgi:hypothetical protein
MVTSIILLSFIINIINSQSTSTKCPRYTCNDQTESPTTCAKITPVLINSIVDSYDISVNICSNSQTCNYSSTNWSSSTSVTIPCTDKISTLTNSLVDRETCTANSDCASNDCFSSKCRGKAVNTACSSTTECARTLYCDSNSKLCLAQKNLTSSCTLDDECVNQGGCFNGKCTKYWSLENGVNVTSLAFGEYYCSSGFAYNGKCVSLTSKDSNPYECTTTNTCNYLVGETNLNLQLDSLCKCGFNPDGKKYCQHDSNSVTFKKYVEVSQTVLDQPCHVSKKFSCTNEINTVDVILRKNYYNAWKGNYQLSEACLISFFSDGGFIKFNFITSLFYFMMIIYLLI